MKGMTAQGKVKSKDFDFEFSGARKWRAYAEGNAVASAAGSRAGTRTAVATDSKSEPTLTESPQSLVPSFSVPLVPISPPLSQLETSDLDYQSNYPQADISEDVQTPFILFSNIRAINRRRGYDLIPEGVILNNEAHSRSIAGEPADGTRIIKLFRKTKC